MRQETPKNFGSELQVGPIEGKREIAKRPNELLMQIKDVAEYIFEYQSYHKHEWLDRFDAKKIEKFREMFGVIKHEEGLSIEQKRLLGEGDEAYAILGYYEHEHPGLKEIYVAILREVRKDQEAKIHQQLNDALTGVHINEDARLKLEQGTIKLEGQKLTPEQIDLLRKSFPSGNFLLHTTSIDSTLECIRVGNILTTAEASLEKEHGWRSNLQEGISFNMNHVQVLTGDDRHFIGFLTLPEAVLDEKTQLAVPYDASRYEAQLVPRPYIRPQNYSQWNSQPKIIQLREGLPRVSVGDAFILCNEGDAEDIKKILAAYGREPRAVLTYPRNELRITSWNIPVGDHQVADKLLSDMFVQASIKPSIDWDNDIFPEGLGLERDDVFVSNKSVEQSRCIMIDDRGSPRVANCGG